MPVRKKPSPAAGVLSLPTKRKSVDTNLLHYVTLIYGRAGIGKTTAFASYPHALFFATEPGLKGLEVFEFNSDDGGCKTWDVIRQGVSLLEKDRGKFEYVIFDTWDRAYDLCAVWVCKQLGIEHVSLDKTGKSDRSGRGWTELKKEFTSILYRLTAAGYGVGLTSHSKAQEVKSASGDAYDIITPSMGAQPLAVVRAVCDYIFYAEYVRDMNANVRRVLFTVGDELVVAKHRGNLPQYLPMPEPGSGETTYDVIKAAFEGKHPGIDASEIIPAKSTAKAARTSMAKGGKKKGTTSARRRRAS